MPTTQLANINNSINRKIFLYEIRCRQKGIEGDQEFHYIQQLFQEIQQRGNTLSMLLYITLESNYNKQKVKI